MPNWEFGLGRPISVQLSRATVFPTSSFVVTTTWMDEPYVKPVSTVNFNVT